MTPLARSIVGDSPSPAPACDRTTAFVLASSSEMLTARELVPVLALPAPALVREVDPFLADRADRGACPVLVGALPFDARRRAHLFEPGGVTWSFGAAAMAPPRLPQAGPPVRRRDYRVASRPSRAEYERAVAAALARMRADDAGGARLRKVVLARSLTVDAPSPIDARALFERLRVDRGITAFSLPLPDEDGRERILVGATPELLLTRHGSTVSSTPLAGSARRVLHDAEADRRAGDALRRSEKDLHEHAAVVEWIVERLRPYCERLTYDPRPTLAATRSMWHLATHITGTLRQPAPASIALAALLHPTPAVCGVPLDLARQTIAELEPFDRGFFAGAVGWCAANGDGRWLVAIRCAEIAASTARLFAGAGIVPDSQPALEADETSAKFSALLEALALSEQEPRLPEEV